MHIGHKNPNYEYFMNGEKFMEVEEEWCASPQEPETLEKL